MLQPDGTAYFYSGIVPRSSCGHSFLYVVLTWNEGTPAFCGLCFLYNVFRDEHPTRIHEYKQLALNGNPETKHEFLNHLQSSLGLAAPQPGQSLRNYRLAREQYSRKPDRAKHPVTSALWELFGSQPKMAKPLLRALLGVEENEIARQMDWSIYNLQTTMAKAIRTALRYVR